MLSDDRFDVGVLDVGGVGEGVQTLNCSEPTPDVTSKIEGGSSGCCHSHPVDLDDFVRKQPFRSDDEFGRGLAVVVDQFGRLPRVDPLHAKRCRCRQTRDDSATLRPQPRGAGPLPRRQRDIALHTDVRVHRLVQATHRSLRDEAGRQRLASDERCLEHGLRVRAVTDVFGILPSDYPQAASHV
jgi:hypothetical protein